MSAVQLVGAVLSMKARDVGSEASWRRNFDPTIVSCHAWQIDMGGNSVLMVDYHDDNSP